MLKWITICILLLSSLLFTTQTVFANGSASEINASVSICGEPWPPFYYPVTNNGSSTITGSDLHILQEISKRTGLQFKTSIVPWKRCLASVEHYPGIGVDNYEVAIDATYNKQRAELFYFIGPISMPAVYAFYSSNKFPQKPRVNRKGDVIKKISDFKGFSICGLLGWNYDIYYSKYNIPQDLTIQTTNGGLSGVMKMISHGHCEIFEAPGSLVAGAIMTGDLTMPENVQCLKLEQTPANFYMLISKKSPRAQQLVTMINQAIIGMKETGEFDSIQKKALKEVIPNSVKSVLNCLY